MEAGRYCHWDGEELPALAPDWLFYTNTFCVCPPLPVVMRIIVVLV